MLERWTPWIMLAVWSSWLAAVQGLLASPDRLDLWVPDLSLLLLVACAGRFESRDVPKAALVIGLGRIAFSVEPPAALLVGLLVAGTIVVAVRTVAEVNGPLMRTALTALCTFGFGAWLVIVHVVRTERAGGGTPIPLGFALSLWRGALATALLGFFVGPLLAYLPGLTRLRRRRW